MVTSVFPNIRARIKDIVMEWYRRLYLGEGVKEKRDQLITRIEKNAGTRRIRNKDGIFLITLASNGRDLFDIIKADYLLQPAMHEHCPMIIGITDKYDEAATICSSIIVDMYKKNHNFDLPAYLKQNIRDGGDIAFHYPKERLKPRFRFLRAFR